jgi:mRNA interferase MazF
VVVTVPRQGEVWWGEAPSEKGRPYLVVSRNQAIESLPLILVAPVTRTIRSIPSELALGADEGLHVESVATFDNLDLFERALLVRRLGALDVSRRPEFCTALRATADC